MAGLELGNGVNIPDADLVVRFVRSGGPGGQNVNKVSTKAELRFQLEQCAVLSAPRKQRLRAAFPSHVTQSGEFVITSDRFRSQSMNHADALERLREMIQSVWLPPRPRVKTKPSAAAKRRRVVDKRERGVRKRERAGKDF